MQDSYFFFFFNDTAPPEIYPLPPHAPLPIKITMPLGGGLFGHKNPPADVREKIIAVAKKTVMSDRAQKLAKETGAIVYWQTADETNARIEADIATLGVINGALE